VPLAERYFGDKADVTKSNDLAAMFVGEIPPVSYDVQVVFRRNEETNAIEPNNAQDSLLENCAYVDQLCYPLLYLFASLSWTTSNSDLGHSGKPTLAQFYNFIFQIREGKFNPLFRVHKGTLQCVTDAGLKVVDDKLRYIREHGQKILHRSETAETLRQLMAEQGRLLNKPVGRLVILPTTFRRGQKFMNKQYLDTMAILSKHGTPDLFITVACNPKSPEMVEAMKAGGMNDIEQFTNYRHDVVMRVFWYQFKVLFSELIFYQVLGAVRAFAYVLELQKFGLPHVHFFLVFEREFKINTPQQIDAIIRAEFPDPEKEPKLFVATKKFMCHRPCNVVEGEIRSQRLKCHREVPGQPGVLKCRFNYPIAYEPYTVIPDKGPVRYRRRQNGRGFIQNGCFIDNQSVSPTNPTSSYAIRCT